MARRKTVKLTRDELKQILARSRMDTMFGDGLESDYIWEGTTIVGLNEMSDEELIAEHTERYSDEKVKIID